jgi:hypothetical protein
MVLAQNAAFFGACHQKGPSSFANRAKPGDDVQEPRNERIEHLVASPLHIRKNDWTICRKRDKTFRSHSIESLDRFGGTCLSVASGASWPTLADLK